MAAPLAQADPKLDAAEVWQAEAARRAAMLAADVQALDLLLSEEVVWIHASAKRDTKKSLIEQFASGRLRCIRLDHPAPSLRLLGQVALVTGLVEMEVVAGAERRAATNLYTAAWSKDDSGLRLVHWQSTRAEPAQ